ncbi:hypothetical protein CYG49_04140 [Candidatus Saccharibacteria bacterium]|nr:MAG: hypothetical protein CYG49_04140 [Candidatus Saccharibacteria bacterium]
MNTEHLGPKIVVIGGGTGSFTLLSGLKHYARDITALVNMADDGGSTGQLRDELGALPPGDVRQCLVALSNTPKVRELFNYRFEEGSGLKGHAFGNLFLTALEKMTGSFGEAVELAGEVLNITGRVEPVTLSDVKLCIKTSDGTITRGEFNIANLTFNGQRPEIWLEPEPAINPAAAKAIAQADVIVVAPGNLYGSLAPALVVPGIGEALAAAKAKKVYICNLVTKPGQTDGFSVLDYADELERFAGTQFLDYVVYNAAKPSDDLLGKYAKEGEFAVEFDELGAKERHYKTIAARLISDEIWQGGQAHDPIAHARTLIRHDSDRAARQLMKIFFS